MLTLFIWLWQRFHSDFWPIDRSPVAPNILAALLCFLVGGIVTYLLWPRLRHSVDAWVKGHLKGHSAEIHSKLDHLLVHLAAAGHIPAYGTTAVAETVHTGEQLIAALTPKGSPHMDLAADILADIEHRFGYHPNSTPAVGDLHDAARTILTDAAKALTNLMPMGGFREVSLVLTKLEEADHWVHAAIARHQDVPVKPAEAPVRTDQTPADTAANAGLDPKPAPVGDELPPVKEPVVPAAPVEPAPVTAPVEVSHAAVPPVETGAVATTPASSPVAVAPGGSALSEAVELFKFTPTVAGEVFDATAWPLAPVVAADGSLLYTWAGSGAAPISPSWTQYTGAVVPPASA